MREIDPHLPINSTAARVVSKSKEHGHTSFHPGSKIVSMVPLPTRPFTGPQEHDLTGFKTGSFNVIGCALYKPKNHLTSENNTRWVVKCKCGRYQLLTTKAVKKNHPDTACVECVRTNRSRFKTTYPHLIKQKP